MNPNDYWGVGGAAVGGSAIIVSSVNGVGSDVRYADGTLIDHFIWVGQGGAASGGEGDWE